MDDSWRILRILDADPAELTALAELGFGADLVRRCPPGTRYFDRAVANLRRDLDEMVSQSITAGIPPDWARPLEDLLRSEWSVASPFEEIGWGDRILRVPPLAVQRQIEVHRQRQDRVDAIDDYCRSSTLEQHA